MYYSPKYSQPKDTGTCIVYIVVVVCDVICLVVVWVYSRVTYGMSPPAFGYPRDAQRSANSKSIWQLIWRRAGHVTLLCLG